MARVSTDFSRVRRKFSKVSIQRGRYAAANQMLSDMNQFVPKDEGNLRLTGSTNKSGTEIIWNTPYASRMFWYRMYNYTTPGTGPRWDLKAKKIYMSDWLRAFLKGAEW